MNTTKIFSTGETPVHINKAIITNNLNKSSMITISGLGINVVSFDGVVPENNLSKVMLYGDGVVEIKIDNTELTTFTIDSIEDSVYKIDFYFDEILLGTNIVNSNKQYDAQLFEADKYKLNDNIVVEYEPISLPADTNIIKIDKSLIDNDLLTANISYNDSNRYFSGMKYLGDIKSFNDNHIALFNDGTDIVLVPMNNEAQVFSINKTIEDLDCGVIKDCVLFDNDGINVGVITDTSFVELSFTFDGKFNLIDSNVESHGLPKFDIFGACTGGYLFNNNNIRINGEVIVMDFESGNKDMIKINDNTIFYKILDKLFAHNIEMNISTMILEDHHFNRFVDSNVGDKSSDIFENNEEYRIINYSKILVVVNKADLNAEYISRIRDFDAESSLTVNDNNDLRQLTQSHRTKFDANGDLLMNDSNHIYKLKCSRVQDLPAVDTEINDPMIAEVPEEVKVIRDNSSHVIYNTAINNNIMKNLTSKEVYESADIKVIDDKVCAFVSQSISFETRNQINKIDGFEYHLYKVEYNNEQTVIDILKTKILKIPALQNVGPSSGNANFVSTPNHNYLVTDNGHVVVYDNDLNEISRHYEIKSYDVVSNKIKYYYDHCVYGDNLIMFGVDITDNTVKMTIINNDKVQLDVSDKFLNSNYVGLGVNSIFPQDIACSNGKLFVKTILTVVADENSVDSYIQDPRVRLGTAGIERIYSYEINTGITNIVFEGDTDKYFNDNYQNIQVDRKTFKTHNDNKLLCLMGNEVLVIDTVNNAITYKSANISFGENEQVITQHLFSSGYKHLIETVNGWACILFDLNGNQYNYLIDFNSNVSRINRGAKLDNLFDNHMREITEPTQLNQLAEPRLLIYDGNCYGFNPRQSGAGDMSSSALFLFQKNSFDYDKYSFDKSGLNANDKVEITLEHYNEPNFEVYTDGILTELTPTTTKEIEPFYDYEPDYDLIDLYDRALGTNSLGGSTLSDNETYLRMINIEEGYISFKLTADNILNLNFVNSFTGHMTYFNTTILSMNTYVISDKDGVIYYVNDGGVLQTLQLTNGKFIRTDIYNLLNITLDSKTRFNSTELKNGQLIIRDDRIYYIFQYNNEMRCKVIHIDGTEVPGYEEVKTIEGLSNRYFSHSFFKLTENGFAVLTCGQSNYGSSNNNPQKLAVIDWGLNANEYDLPYNRIYTTGEQTGQNKLISFTQFNQTKDTVLGKANVYDIGEHLIVCSAWSDGLNDSNTRDAVLVKYSLVNGEVVFNASEPVSNSNPIHDTSGATTVYDINDMWFVVNSGLSNYPEIAIYDKTMKLIKTPIRFDSGQKGPFFFDKNLRASYVYKHSGIKAVEVPLSLSYRYKYSSMFSTEVFNTDNIRIKTADKTTAKLVDFKTFSYSKPVLNQTERVDIIAGKFDERYNPNTPTQKTISNYTLNNEDINDTNISSFKVVLTLNDITQSLTTTQEVDDIMVTKLVNKIMITTSTDISKSLLYVGGKLRMFSDTKVFTDDTGTWYSVCYDNTSDFSSHAVSDYQFIDLREGNCLPDLNITIDGNVLINDVIYSNMVIDTMNASVDLSSLCGDSTITSSIDLTDFNINMDILYSTSI